MNPSLAVSSNPNTSTDVSVDFKQAADLARTDLDFLAGISLPDMYKYAFPDLYRAMWGWMCEQIEKGRDFSQLAIGLPRGFAKTLLIKLFIVYTILFTTRRFILIFSENTDKAVSIVSDVMDILEEPNIVAIFGSWQEGAILDQQAKKVMAYRGREIIIKAAGAGSGIRGITEKNTRPDLMIFDDIQSREDAESDLLSDQLEKWMIGTAMKTKSPEGCLFVFIANMYPVKGSLLRKLKQNPNWIKFIVGGITSDGKSLWEELQPLEQLMKEFENDLASGHPEIFYAEVLNDENASVNNIIDLSKVPDWRYQEDDIPQGRFIIIDPSGDKIGADPVSIGAFQIFDEYPCLTHLIEGRLSPADTIRETLTMAMSLGISLIAIESVAYQATLGYWFAFICAQMGITGIECVEIYPGSRAKNTRIMEMLRMLPRGDIKIHPRCRPAAWLQITQWNPLKTVNNDGILDLLWYSPKVIEMFGAQIISGMIISEQEHSALKVLEHNSPF